MTKAEHLRRIQFYMRKAARYALDKRPRHQRNRYRFSRLMTYKQALNARLEAAGYRWRPSQSLEAMLQ